ncbi:MAG TPA: hypothetical protein HPP80_04820 [Rhodospirillaceae bacterium]|nr:hypothetical protein [Rhodospirillaceae bacterium]
MSTPSAVNRVQTQALPSAAVGFGGGAIGTVAAAKTSLFIGLGKGLVAGAGIMVLASPLAAGATVGVLAGVLHAATVCRVRHRAR